MYTKLVRFELTFNRVVLIVLYSVLTAKYIEWRTHFILVNTLSNTLALGVLIGNWDEFD